LAKAHAMEHTPRLSVDRSMANKEPPPRDELSDLRQKVGAARAKEASKNDPPPDSAASLALRFGGEFGAAVLVGALLGIGTDHFLHTDPWGLIIGLGLGFAAGIVNVVRVAQSYSKAHPIDPNAPSVPDDEDD
jgi:ATP synthase protein I